MTKKLLIGFLLIAPLPAFAGQPEARAVALANDCKPKKIEIMQNSIGGDGETIYRVQCDVPKTTGDADPSAPNALLISCQQNLCDLMNAVTSGDKK